MIEGNAQKVKWKVGARKKIFSRGGDLPVTGRHGARGAVPREIARPPEPRPAQTAERLRVAEKREHLLREGLRPALQRNDARGVPGHFGGRPAVGAEHRKPRREGLRDSNVDRAGTADVREGGGNRK